ncbi:hypothetical protein MKZ38_007494 [Zalerion maritima]|uniref:Uncharacterized protein n=1 Tax=Zalerion maritima TaxID=339359 RepID=A0AAD5RVL5_9PEZI|nr:hypothetical protein MKZ38_007494 [Zalerion maritima]
MVHGPGTWFLARSFPRLNVLNVITFEKKILKCQLVRQELFCTTRTSTKSFTDQLMAEHAPTHQPSGQGKDRLNCNKQLPVDAALITVSCRLDPTRRKGEFGFGLRTDSLQCEYACADGNFREHFLLSVFSCIRNYAKLR